MLIVTEQLDELIGYMNGRSYISKYLKQGLLKLQKKTVALVKKEYDLLTEERSAADACKEKQSTQSGSFMDSFFSAGRWRTKSCILPEP